MQVQIEERENQGGIIRTLLLDLNIVWHSALGAVNWRLWMVMLEKSRLWIHTHSADIKDCR